MIVACSSVNGKDPAQPSKVASKKSSPIRLYTHFNTFFKKKINHKNHRKNRQEKTYKNMINPYAITTFEGHAGPLPFTLLYLTFLQSICCTYFFYVHLIYLFLQQTYCDTCFFNILLVFLYFFDNILLLSLILYLCSSDNRSIVEY